MFRRDIFPYGKRGAWTRESCVDSIVIDPNAKPAGKVLVRYRGPLESRMRDPDITHCNRSSDGQHESLVSDIKEAILGFASRHGLHDSVVGVEIRSHNFHVFLKTKEDEDKWCEVSHDSEDPDWPRFTSESCRVHGMDGRRQRAFHSNYD